LATENRDQSTATSPADDDGRPGRLGGVGFPPQWFAWIALVTVAVVLPPEATARSLYGTYTATLGSVTLGIWIFKCALGFVGIVGLLLPRLPGASTGTIGRPAPFTFAGWLAIAGVTTLALTVRVSHLGTELWLDEIEMLTRYVPLDLRHLVSTYDSQNHHPLYTIAAHLSWLLARGADWSIRLPAMLCGTAAVFALGRFSRYLTGQAEAVLAALVLAVSYHAVWFSQNARGYTTILLLTILATGIFLRLLSGEGHRVRLSWTYATLIALATYTHLTAALVAAGHALVIVFTTRWRDPEGRRVALWASAAIALGGLLTICLYAPMLPQLIHQLTKSSPTMVETEWTSLGWMMREGTRALAGGVPGGLPAAAVAVTVLAVGIGSLWHRSRQAVLAMFLPVVVTGAAVMATGHNLWPRFFFFGAGFLVLAAIEGGFAIVRRLVPWRPTRVATTGAIAVAALSLLTVPRAWQPKQQFLAVHDWIESQRIPGDAVVALDIAFHPYLLRGGAPTWILTSFDALLGDVERTAGRTWIVYTLPARLQAISPDAWARIHGPAYQEIRVFPSTVGGGDIHVLRSDPRP